MEIKYNLTNTNYNSGRGTSVKWIVVHNTANGTAKEGTAYNNTVYFKDTYREASAHYFIDDGPVVWCCVEPDDTAWHCGEAASRNGAQNNNAIGIEVCEPSWGEFSDSEKRTLRELVTHLMREYGVDADHVCRHNDVTGKNCPWYYANDNAAWKELHKYITSNEFDEGDEDSMVCIFQPNGASEMIYYDGTNLHKLDNPDEMEAIKMVYSLCNGGKEIPIFKLGSKNAPWASRFCDAVKHGAPNYMMH